MAASGLETAVRMFSDWWGEGPAYQLGCPVISGLPGGSPHPPERLEIAAIHSVGRRFMKA
jgi:hypothetical protein